MKHWQRRLTALLLVAVMCAGMLPAAAAADMDAASDRTIPLYGNAVTGLSREAQTALLEQALDQQQLIDVGEVGQDVIMDEDAMVDVIVRLDVDSLYDVQRSGRTLKEMEFSDFLQTAQAQAQMETINAAQEAVQEQLRETAPDSSVSYVYSTLLSGFAATVRYGDIPQLEQLPGVKRVELCTVYEKEETEAFPNEGVDNATYPAGASYANATAYQGEGMLIGILDTGLDTAHEAFVNAPAQQKLQKSQLEDLLYEDGEDGKIVCKSYAAYFSAAGRGYELTTDDLYKSGKVPFAYDYADYDPEVCPSTAAVEAYGNDHGTHVAGIAAGKAVDGNGDVTFAGAAPEAQLAIFKVFSDQSSGAGTAAIVAALCDAMLLGVDVINMSLGSAGGFGAEDSESLLTELYGLLDQAGISMCTSAGNSYSSAYGASGGDYATTSNVDSGIISSPSSYATNLSVASVNAGGERYFSLDGTSIAYTELSGHDFAAELGAGAYTYVMIPGAGAAEDFEGLDVQGKIAVIRRGEISFEQKQLNAAAAGAAACLIYNNRLGEAVSMAIEDVRIPTASITLTAGEQMAAAQEKVLRVDGSAVGEAKMSSFSSWGPLPSLELKPEITAPGGGIYSSVPFNNAYDYMSGTSMASPYMAGMTAAMRQALIQEDSQRSSSELEALANCLFMSTAVPLETDGLLVSPRKQGAGVVNLQAALETGAYLYTEENGRPKVELGDDKQKTGVYDVTFHVKNRSQDTLEYTISTSVLTEAVTSDGKYMAQKAYVLSADTSSITVSGATLDGSTLRVPAGADAQVTVRIVLSSADRAYFAQNYPYGCYVEGFVFLSSENDVDLSLPYLGFYGDWTQAPMLDYDVFSGEEADVFASTVYGVYNDQSLMIPGYYALQLPEGVEEPAFSEEKIALALNAGTAYGYLYALPLGLLRGAKQANVTIADRDTGEVYAGFENTNVRKAFYNQSSGIMYPAFVGEIYPDWYAMTPSGLDNNTRLEITAKVKPDAAEPYDNVRDTFTFHMTVDYEAPYVVNRDSLGFYEGEDGRMYLDVTFEDNHYLMGATLYSAARSLTGSLGANKMYYDYFTPLVHEDGSDVLPGEQITVTYDVTDFYDKLYEGTFFIVAYDYALNCCVYQVSMESVTPTAIAIETAEKTISVGQSEDLIVSFEPSNATDKRLSWSSSDEETVVVRDGRITGLKPGSAVITAVSEADRSLKAACTVTVTGEGGSEIPVEQLTLSTRTVQMAVGGSARLTVTFTPYNTTDRALRWSSSDEQVATVENGLVTAVGAGSCTVTVEASNGVCAECQVSVYDAGEGGFVIDESGVLTGYTGTASIVTIPDGVTAIGSKAFYNNATMQEVYVPESVTAIGDYAFGYCSALQKADLSRSGVTTLGKYAFSSCQQMRSVDLPETLETIGDSAFNYCKNLQSIVIPASVRSIGKNAFNVCNNLRSAHFEGSPEEMGVVFNACYTLETVTGELEQLSDGMFTGCYSLGEFRIPEKVTYIGANAFTSCNASTSGVVMPDGSKIYPEGLKKLIFSSGSAFKAVPGALGGLITYKCTSFTGFVVEDGNENLRINSDGWLVSTDGSYLVDGVHDAALTSLTIPAGTEYLGDGAFSGCTGLTTLSLPDGLIYIGSYAFADPSKSASAMSLPLTRIELPDTVQTVGDYAFAGCQQASVLSAGSGVKSIGDYAFYNCKKVESIVLPRSLSSIGAYAFYNCNAAKTIDLSATALTEIPKYGFYSCKSAGTLTLPPQVTNIGASAFYGTGNSVTELKLPETLETIGSSAFNGFYALKSLDLSQTRVTTIDSSAFSMMKSIETLLLPETLTKIGSSAFANMNSGRTVDDPHVSGVRIPAAVSDLNKGAFTNCKLLSNITVDEANETYYNDADGAVRKRSDDSLVITPAAAASVTEDFTIPEGMTEIPSGYLQNNTTLRHLTIPAYVTSVGSNAFRGCVNLETVVFEAGGQDAVINSSAFYGCTSLRSVTFAGNLRTIGTSAFYGCTSLTRLELPSALQSIGMSAFAECTGLTQMVLPDSVGTLGNGAFRGCSNLQSVTLPQGLTALPKSVFQDCTSLKTLTLPDALEEIGMESAFAGCTALESFAVSGGNRYFRAIDGVLLDTAGKILACYPAGRPGENYRVPDGVARIGEYAFQDAVNLRAVTLPSSVVRIGEAAFYGCNALTDYRFESMTAPLLECDQYYGAATLQIARYRNFKDYYFDVVDGKIVEKELGLDLYYPEGATGYDARIWQAFFSTRTAAGDNMLSVANPTAERNGDGSVQLHWDPVEQEIFGNVSYRVERAEAVHVSDGDQDTWAYGEFTVLTEDASGCAFTDTAPLKLGLTYAYRVSACTADQTGPGAIATISITAMPGNADEAAAEAVIRAIEGLKPLDQLRASDEEQVQQVLEQYEALTDDQKALVHNFDDLLLAQDYIAAEKVAEQIDDLPKPTQIRLTDSVAVRAARSAYNTLTARQKALVRNYDKLRDCEQMLAVLSEASIQTGGTSGAQSEPESGDTFLDIRGHWAQREIERAVELGLFSGVSSTSFAPDASMTRAMLVTVLYRMAGEPAVTGASAFTDVERGSWYEPAVVWAARNGIVNGVSAESFAPTQPVTREQMIAILYRYEQSRGTDVSAQVALDGFADAAQVSAYARTPMAWAVAEGIITGTTTGLAPQQPCTRAQVATILVRLLEG